jgi:hypothetical protein
LHLEVTGLRKIARVAIKIADFRPSSRDHIGVSATVDAGPISNASERSSVARSFDQAVRFRGARAALA